MAKTPKNIAVVYRPYSKTAFKTASELVQWLHTKKYNLFSPTDLEPLPHAKKITSSGIISKIDLVIAMGGDGTFLRAVRLLKNRSVPILGVNLGNLGFLTETPVDELYDTVKLALKNKIPAQKRAAFLATVVKKNGKKETFYALNDIVIERGPNDHLIDLSIYTKDSFVSTVKADGVIVATPTGSTAYCLAAGGPIVHPSVPAMTITPICPHTLTNRPIILPDTQPLTFKLQDHQSNAVLMIDGRRCGELALSDELVITKSKTPVLMLSQPSKNYFDILRAKLRFGQRE